MWPTLIIGPWTNNTLTASGNVGESVYKILYFATCSCARSNSATMVEWFAGCAKGLGAVNNCLVRSAYSSANQRNAEQTLLLQWRESTKSWNIDQGPPAALLKTHCDPEDSSMDQDDSGEVMVQLLGSLPTLNVNDGRATVDRSDEPFVPMGHQPAGEDEVKVLYVDAREQTADGSFVCANVTQTVHVHEANGE
jgi:hypothetical protein